eukprot:TRINITY_DN3688_c4_g1_i1.p1 TRINITY_DN3688_c4_g1~~TRINITY_DN3688_c4_g1_i1.p1  ORF type:complete len:457 (-),score=70.09 TRINITY_DN3688_c4_g1_i1:176-1546(-)
MAAGVIGQPLTDRACSRVTTPSPRTFNGWSPRLGINDMKSTDKGRQFDSGDETPRIPTGGSYASVLNAADWLATHPAGTSPPQAIGQQMVLPVPRDLRMPEPILDAAGVLSHEERQLCATELEAEAARLARAAVATAALARRLAAQPIQQPPPPVAPPASSSAAAWQQEPMKVIIQPQRFGAPGAEEIAAYQKARTLLQQPTLPARQLSSSSSSSASSREPPLRRQSTSQTSGGAAGSSTDLPLRHLQVSLGSVGHPRQCAEPCRYVKRKGGCREGDKCPNCHLCFWRRRPADKHQEQPLRVGICSDNPAEDRASDVTSLDAPLQGQSSTELLASPGDLHRSATPEDQRDASKARSTAGHEVEEAAPIETDRLCLPCEAEGGGAVPSRGSLGHPTSCQPACKYHRRKDGCRSGWECMKCHLCQWSRRTHATTSNYDRDQPALCTTPLPPGLLARSL